MKKKCDSNQIILLIILLLFINVAPAPSNLFLSFPFLLVSLIPSTLSLLPPPQSPSTYFLYFLLFYRSPPFFSLIPSTFSPLPSFSIYFISTSSYFPSPIPPSHSLLTSLFSIPSTSLLSSLLTASFIPSPIPPSHSLLTSLFSIPSTSLFLLSLLLYSFLHSYHSFLFFPRQLFFFLPPCPCFIFFLSYPSIPPFYSVQSLSLLFLHTSFLQCSIPLSPIPPFLLPTVFNPSLSYPSIPPSYSV